MTDERRVSNKASVGDGTIIDEAVARAEASVGDEGIADGAIARGEASRSDDAAPRVASPAYGTAGKATHGPDVGLLRRVRWQLVAWSGGVTLAILVILGAALYSSVAGSLAASGAAQLRDRASELTRFLGHEQFPRQGPPIGFSFGGPSSGTFALVVDPEGHHLGPSDLQLPEGLPNDAGVAAARAGTVDIRDATVAGTPVRILSQSVDRASARYIIQVVQDRTAEQRTLNVLLAVLIGGGIGALALSIAGGSVYAQRALVPIRDSLRRQREFAADASHELRTPLAVIRASVDHLRRHPRKPVADVGTAIDDIEAEIGHLTELVEDLLLLARADSGAIQLERQPFDLADVAEDALPALGTLAAGRDVRVVLDPLPAPTVGDPARLRQVITILADNAVRHSPAGTTVTVRVREDRGQATLEVEDQGPGVRPEDAARIFDRFWRAPDAPSEGTGLGLAIARWIVDRHGGTIAVANRTPSGALFTVRLPAIRS